jgi:hypothetical protein
MPFLFPLKPLLTLYGKIKRTQGLNSILKGDIIIKNGLLRTEKGDGWSKIKVCCL